ncbi:MAG: hypothetical protein ACE5OZ_18420 [Candidatus Heimdallarchaeota archaeon]
MKNQSVEGKEKRLGLASALSGLLSHERADSQLTRSFVECEQDEYKPDCIIKVLKNAIDIPELYTQHISTIIALHSQAIHQKPTLLEGLNSALRLIDHRYDPEGKRVVPLDELEVHPPESRYLLIEEHFIPDPFYQGLIQEINRCFNVQAYSASKILIRKLFENLLIDLLRSRFRHEPDKQFLYWNSEKRWHPRFVILIKNLEKNSVAFESFAKNFDAAFLAFLEEIRAEGNESAHSIEEQVTRGTLLTLKQNVELYTTLCFRVLKQV